MRILSSSSSLIIIQAGTEKGQENRSNRKLLAAKFPSGSEVRGKGRIKDGQPSSKATGRGTTESSVGTDDPENPVCVVGNLGVVANITSQNAPLCPGEDPLELVLAQDWDSIYFLLEKGEMGQAE